MNNCNCKTDFFKAIIYNYSIFLSTILIISAVLIFFLVSVSSILQAHPLFVQLHASLILPKSSPTLTVISLPKGTPFNYSISPNNTTATAIVTGYTTRIPIYISPSTNTTYHGKVPWKYHGTGKTVTYNGTTYTLYHCTKILNTTNPKTNICSFYYYLSQNTLFDSNQTALLEASNASLTHAKLAIAAITQSNESLPYGEFKLSGKYAKAGTLYKNAYLQGRLSSCRILTSIQKEEGLQIPERFSCW